MIRNRPHAFWVDALAVVAVGLAVLARLALWGVLGEGFPYLFFFAAITLAGWYGGFRPGLIATILGAIAATAGTILSGAAFDFTQPRDAVALGLFVLIGIGISALCENLHRTRRRLGVTLDSIGDAVIVTDALGRVRSLNPVAEKLTGWSDREAHGQPLSDVFHIIDEQTGKPVENPARRALLDGVVVGLANHTVLLAKDGTSTPIDDSAAPVRGDDGTVIGCVLVFRDVAPRRRSELALRHSEEELSDFFENANVGMHWVGPDGTILRVNRAELKMLGYAESEYVGRHIADFHVDRTVIDDILRRLEAGEILDGVPALMRAKDGSIREVLINSSVRWEEGRFLHTRSFTLDVTDRRRADRANALLAAVVESSDDAIVAKTLDGTIVSWNGGAARLFGYTAEEAVGQPITLVIPEDRRDEEVEIIAQLRRGERVDHFDTVRRTKDGRMVHVALTISPIYDETGKIIGASKVARDITDRHMIEEERIEADRRKDEFLATLAHELRNPLAPIRNAVHVLRLAGDGADQRAAALEIMDRQLEQMVRLIDDLIDVSRISRGKLELRHEPFELSAAIHHAVEASRPLIEAAGQELSVHVPEEPIHLEADLQRLAQVFANLLNNASKFTPPGGRIRLEVERGERQVAVCVRDTGVGIPEDKLGSIFELFTQLDPSLEREQAGLGIGLTLGKRIVEMHGGSIEAKSKGAGRGSTFIVRLPLTVDVPAGVAAGSDGEDSVRVDRKRILVVDDNRDGADSLAMLLNVAGHEIHLAHDGEDAFAEARRLRPDVVLLDIGLPKMNGYEVCRRIRGEPWGKGISIVALTGWGQQQDRDRSNEAGFDAHLVKPVDYDEMMKVIA